MAGQDFDWKGWPATFEIGKIPNGFSLIPLLPGEGAGRRRRAA
jgi:hypothetical protein